jgi:hypothetical protein
MASRFPIVMLMVLASGCAETVHGHEPSAPPGDSIELMNDSPTIGHREPVHLPSPNQALLEAASPSVSRAYTDLLRSTKNALGTGCGATGTPTRTWTALSELVRADRSDMLRDLSIRATTTAARAAAIIGLAKLRSVSYAHAEDMLRRLPGTVDTCAGIDEHSALPETVAELLYLPVVGQSNEVPLP